MKGYQGFCNLHGAYADTVLCQQCLQETLSLMFAYSEEQARMSSTHTFDSYNYYNFSNKKVPTGPISLGRWEEQTDYDRNFLKSLGISKE